jgi:hypothetical protein
VFWRSFCVEGEASAKLRNRCRESSPAVADSQPDHVLRQYLARRVPASGDQSKLNVYNQTINRLHLQSHSSGVLAKTEFSGEDEAPFVIRTIQVRQDGRL